MSNLSSSHPLFISILKSEDYRRCLLPPKYSNLLPQTKVLAAGNNSWLNGIGTSQGGRALKWPMYIWPDPVTMPRLARHHFDCVFLHYSGIVGSLRAPSVRKPRSSISSRRGLISLPHCLTPYVLPPSKDIICSQNFRNVWWVCTHKWKLFSEADPPTPLRPLGPKRTDIADGTPPINSYPPWKYLFRVNQSHIIILGLSLTYWLLNICSRWIF